MNFQNLQSQGNDLSTPTRSFPGLKPGDNWCLCASRWKEAERGKHPKVLANSTHIKTHDHIGRIEKKDYK